MSVLRIGAATQNAIATALASILSMKRIRIYTGSRPANPNDAAVGTLLFEAALGAIDPPAGASIDLTWADTSVQAEGLAGWARIDDPVGGSVYLDTLTWAQSTPNPPDGVLLLPTLSLTVNLYLSGALTLPVLMEIE